MEEENAWQDPAVQPLPGPVTAAAETAEGAHAAACQALCFLLRCDFSF